jgi:hypothetical protein
MLARCLLLVGPQRLHQAPVGLTGTGVGWLEDYAQLVQSRVLNKGRNRGVRVVSYHQR